MKTNECSEAQELKYRQAMGDIADQLLHLREASGCIHIAYTESLTLEPYQITDLISCALSRINQSLENIDNIYSKAS